MTASIASMRNLTFKKTDIINGLTEARKEHVKILEEAQKGYREMLIEELEEKLADAKAGKRVDPRIDLIVPPHHVEEFDRAIKMLEMCKDEIITLTQPEFQMYVGGEWGWQHDFLMANAAYSESAAVMSQS